MADQEQRFRSRHPAFFENVEALDAAVTIAFRRTCAFPSSADAVVFLLGSRCEEEFREVALLAAHGHGSGATAHLRGMYERAVTCGFIHANPDAVDDFVDYDVVRRWKGAQAIKRTFGLNAEDETRSAALRAEFERVRNRFEVPDCKRCGSKRLNHSWIALDFVSMAAKTGKFGDLIVPAYYLPLAQAHATIASAVSRIAEVPDGSFALDPALNEAEADHAFQFGHLIILYVLLVQGNRFDLPGFTPVLDRAFEHYKQAWHV